MSDDLPPQSRREARAQRERGARLTDAVPVGPAHAAPHRGRLFVAAGVAGLLVLGAVAVGMAVLPSSAADEADDAPVASAPAATVQVEALPEEGLPVPQQTSSAATSALCADAEVAAALEAGDDRAAIAAAGGGEALRAAVAAGLAPCVALDDPDRLWFVVNKQRPYDPIDYAPDDIVIPSGVRSISGGGLRQDAATALDELVAAAAADGAGDLAMQSGYRSYSTQQQSYGIQVSQRGVDGADLVSARPGYSEHQSGATADMVPCTAGACGTLDDLAASTQGAWIVDNAWRYGWIVRYEEGRTDVTGYSPEAWHLRYIGTDLAAAYHDGGWTTLEEFFGLPAAPDYAD